MSAALGHFSQLYLVHRQFQLVAHVRSPTRRPKSVPPATSHTSSPCITSITVIMRVHLEFIDKGVREICGRKSVAADGGYLQRVFGNGYY